MANSTEIRTRIIQKHDIAQNWENSELIPLQGEIIIYDIDENYNYERIKIGDGVTLAKDLPFVKAASEAIIETDKTLTKPDQAADAEQVGLKLKDIDDKIKELQYKEIEILEFKVVDADTNKSKFEYGAKINKLKATWSFNKTPISMTFDGQNIEPVDEDGFERQLDSPIIDTDSWTLTATDEKGYSTFANSDIIFQHGVYYGSLEVTGEEITSDMINSLSKELRNSVSNFKFRVTTSGNDMQTLALPASFSQPLSFTINGLSYEWELVKTQWMHENELGYEVEYNVWQNTNATEGTYDIIVNV